MDTLCVDIAIIGSGSAGLYALGQVRSSGKRFVLINGGETGTTCARVGCMPSKALIQVAEEYHRCKGMGRYGIEGHEAIRLDGAAALEHVRDLRDTFVERVRSNSTDKLPAECFIQGHARFLDSHTLEVDGRRVEAQKIIVATGSLPVMPAPWAPFRNRILTTDEVFELEQLPHSMAVIGLGVIGLEIGQSLARLGVAVSGFDALEQIGGITDPEVNRVAVESIGREFPLYLGQPATISEGEDGRLKVSAGDRVVEVERVLASLGRRPNLDGLAIDKAGVPMDERGVPRFDRHTMRVGESSIYIAGDANNERPLLHEAGDEGRIAGYNASNDPQVPFQRKAPLAITFCDPNICLVGKRWSELDLEQVAIGEVKMAPVGRALIMGKNRGAIRLYADRREGRLLGAEICCARAEHLGHLLAWSLQQGLTVGELLQMPYYHPVMEEALQAALNHCYGQLESRNAGPIAELRCCPPLEGSP